MTALHTSTGQPDILEVIADLSNDEVFTPPQVARDVLDLLPDEVWRNPDLRWLDPGTKTGVFLREITRRLMVGLAEKIPSDEERLQHILHNMVFGVAITELTALMSRRTLYCSKNAAGEVSVVHMPTPDGNIWFERIEHSYNQKGKCSECGASAAQLERGEGRENYAYGFIHKQGLAAIEEKFGMKFDVVVGNPPYQMDDGGHNASATPIYQHFVESAINLSPRFVLMITPSRWFTGGKGLESFRARMLTSGRLRRLVDFPKLYDGFPGVKIRGGISYFLWDRDEPGLCLVQTMWDGVPHGDAVARNLGEFDVLIRRNEAVSILRKVRSANQGDSLDHRVSSAKPFGLRTYFHGVDDPSTLDDPVKLHGSQRVSWIERGELTVNPEWIDRWKVLMTAVQGTSAAVETMFLSRPIIAGPGEACTETYLVAGVFDDEQSAKNYASYLRTRFVRFLV